MRPCLTIMALENVFCVPVFKTSEIFGRIGEPASEKCDCKRQVQKSDQINSDHQSGSDQLGSTRIIEKSKIIRK